MYNKAKKIIIASLAIILMFKSTSINISANENNYINKSNQEQEVYIPDNNLRKSINTHLNRPLDYKVNRRELGGITNLDLSSENINDIEGLQYCTGLLKLSLDNNNISNIDELKYIKNIMYLDLSSNNIENIDSLKDMGGLKYLYVPNNNIEDISVLKNLTSIEELYLNGNKIYDFTSLNHLKNLKYGNASNQAIELSNENIDSDSLEIKNIFVMPDGSPTKVSNVNEKYIYDDVTGIITIENIEKDKDIYINAIDVYNVGTHVPMYIGGTIKKEIEYDVDTSSILEGIEDVEISVREAEKFNPLDGVIIKDKSVTLDDITVVGEIKKPEVGENKTSTLTYRVEQDFGKIIEIYRDITVTNQIPIISGLEDIVIKKGENVELYKGISSYDHEDKDITKNIKIISGPISNLPIGIHNVHYGVIDSDNNAITKTRKITVNPPSIELDAFPQIFGANDITIKRNQDFDLKEGITATDKEDGNITSAIKIKGSIDTSKIGNQKVTYSITDSKGNQTEVLRNVKIKY